tara:strand:- start:44891 stop:45709 length:819 start_codon:yes stop_codon:yes gene_type:complete
VLPLNNIAFVINRSKPSAQAVAETLVNLTEKQGAKAVVIEDYPLKEGFLEGFDACCAIGGDGTLLGAVSESVQRQVPIFGVNQGKLGFLATFSPEEAQEQWADFLEGHYMIDHRVLLNCKTATGVEKQVLNDVVIKNSVITRLIDLTVSSENDLITECSCDGLIFSTPTGSTAYNLSAGGPIIHPSARVFTLTPICPHTLTHRSVILSDDMPIAVNTLDAEVVPAVKLDGRYHFEDKNEFPLTITISEKTLPLLQSQSYSHFRILRNKLGWG